MLHRLPLSFYRTYPHGSGIERLRQILFASRLEISASPAGQSRDFICIEPMAGITNALNLNHEGKYPDLQSVAPGGKWTGSFCIRAGGI